MAEPRAPHQLKRSIHFRKTLLIAFVLLVSLFVYICYSLGTYDHNDQIAYQNILLQIDPSDGPQEPPLDLNTVSTTSARVGAGAPSVLEASRQFRRGLQKDLYFEKGGDRLRFKIISDSAVLAFERSEGRMRVVENMEDVVCFLQEECLYMTTEGDLSRSLEELIGEESQDVSLDIAGVLLAIPVQRVAIIIADRASYYYHDDLFVADQVKIIRAILPTHLLEGDLPMIYQGSAADAQRLRLTLANDFKADGEGVELLIARDEKTYDAINILSDRMEIGFGSDSSLVIDNILAQDNVRVSYLNYLAESEIATYVRDTEPSSVQTETGRNFPGIITMQGTPSNQRCSLISVQGDRILSKEMKIRTATGQLTMVEPVGLLMNESAKTPVEFSSHSLIWDRSTKNITLRGDVEIDQDGIGHLTTENLIITHGEAEGNNRIKSIVSKGNTRLSYTDKNVLKSDEGDHPTDRHSHTLTSKGQFKVDHEQMETRIYGLPDASGVVQENDQVCFKDPRGEVYGDRALVKYGQIDGRLVPTKIVVVGNVKILNRLSAASGGTIPVLQYVMAERVEFFPETQEMIFTSNSGRRVLLYDRTNNLQVSAPSLKIVRDKATKRETVQGLGDVRFRFIENEFEQLRRKFSLDKFTKK